MDDQKKHEQKEQEVSSSVPFCCNKTHGILILNPEILRAPP